MAVSSAALIPRVRAYLDERPYVTTATAANASTTTVSVTDGTDWEEGAILEFQDNGEQCMVQTIAANNLTVVRGWNGTTAQTHTSIQAFRDPVFTYDNITKCIATGIQGLWPHAWKATDDSVTPLSDGTVWYDLAADAFGLIEVNQRYGTSNQKLGVFGDGRDSRQVVMKRNMPAGLVASSVGIRFPGGFYHLTNTVNIKYATAITGTSDIEDDGDLPVADTVVYGALARLLAGKEAERIGVGEDVEEARSIRVGGRTQVGAYYQRMYQEGKEMLKVLHDRQIPIMPVRRWK